jgi:hypothetical protein
LPGRIPWTNPETRKSPGMAASAAKQSAIMALLREL